MYQTDVLKLNVDDDDDDDIGPVMLGLTINSPCSSTCSTRRAHVLDKASNE